MWPGRALVVVVLVGLVVLVGCGDDPDIEPEAVTDSSSAASVEPSPVPASESPSRVWPDADSTGVPDGIQLVPWDEECMVTEADVIISGRQIDCDLRISADGVRIINSRISGSVSVDARLGYSFFIQDSEVRVSDPVGTGIGDGNFTAIRVEVTGGRRSVNCRVACTVEHSWLHGQTPDPDGATHMSGIRMGQNSSIRFNSITCDAAPTPPGSACSAAITGYGDFAPVRDNLIEGNLIDGGTSAYCAYGGSTLDKPFTDDAANIHFLDNVFVRNSEGTCGQYGPISGFDRQAPGNEWRGNVWDDGDLLPPP